MTCPQCGARRALSVETKFSTSGLAGTHTAGTSTSTLVVALRPALSCRFCDLYVVGSFDEAGGLARFDLPKGEEVHDVQEQQAPQH